MVAENGSMVHLSRSTPTTSRWPISSSGFFLPLPFSRATILPRPGADSKICAGIPSAASTPLMYSAARVSLPGGLLVSILTSSLRNFTASVWAAAKSGADCAHDSPARTKTTDTARKVKQDILKNSLNMQNPLAILKRGRRLAQDIGNYSRIRTARRQAALRHVGRSAAATAKLCHGIFHQLAHIGFLAGTLGKDQRGLAAARSQQRNHVRLPCCKLLGQQLDEDGIAVRKKLCDHLRRARGLSEQAFGVKFCQFFQQLMLGFAGGFGFRQRLAHLVRHIIYMAGIKRRSFRKRGVIAACGVHRAQPADKLHAHALLHLLCFPQQDAADLAGSADVGAATRREIELRDIDQPKVAGLLGRKLAQAELASFLKRYKADIDWAVFGNHFIGQQLRPLRLCGGKTGGFQVDGAAFLAHVEADSRHIEQPDKRSREQVLAGVLLHVVTSSRGIDGAMNLRSQSQRLRRKVKDASVFFVGNFSDGNLLAVGCQRTEIVYLAAAGRIEGGTVEHKGRPAIALERFHHASVKVVEERIVIVEAVSHKLALSN